MKPLILLEGRFQDLLRKVQSGAIAAWDQNLETNRIREKGAVIPFVWDWCFFVSYKRGLG